MIDAAKLSKLQAKSVAIKEPLAHLTNSIREVDRALAALKLGVTASVTTNSDQLGPDCVVSYMKHNGLWGLYVSRIACGDATHTWPLSASPVRFRRAGAAVLDLLVDALLKELEDETVRVRQAADKVEDLVDAFREAGVLKDLPEGAPSDHDGG
jgi:hypothetical protein